MSTATKKKPVVTKKPAATASTEKPRAKHLKPVVVADCPYNVDDVFQAPLARIRASTTNPRTEFPIDDLVATMPKGQISAVQVRWRPDPATDTDYEIAFGERRSRAARHIGWKTIRVELIEKTDAEIEELQLIENMARVDLSDLDEAHGLARLKKLGYTDTQIAERVGKTKAYVARRFGLAGMTDEAKSALREGKITVDAALEFATVIDHAEQRKMVAEALAQRLEGADPITAKTARFAASKYHLALANAPWALDDAELVPSAGSCIACPKRSSQQYQMFAIANDVKDERCTDGACFASKGEAHWKRIVDAAVNMTVVEAPTEAKKYVMWGVTSRDTGFVDLDAAGDEVRDGHTWREQLGARAVATLLVRDEVRPRYLMPRADAVAALRDLGIVKQRAEPVPAATASTADPVAAPADAPLTSDAKPTMTMTIAELVAAAERASVTEGLLRALLMGIAPAIDSMNSEVRPIFERRGLPLPEEKEGSEAIQELVGGLRGAGQLLGLFVELIIAHHGDTRYAMSDHFRGVVAPVVDDAEERVLAAIRGGAKKRAAIMESAGVTPAQWSRISGKLEANGKIVGTGERKAREYTVVERGIAVDPDAAPDPDVEQFDPETTTDGTESTLTDAAIEILTDGPRDRDDLCDTLVTVEGCSTSEASVAIDELVRHGRVSVDLETGLFSVS